MDIGTSVAGDAIRKNFVHPVIQLVKDVIHKNENHQILHTDFYIVHATVARTR